MKDSIDQPEPQWPGDSCLPTVRDGLLALEDFIREPALVLLFAQAGESRSAEASRVRDALKAQWPNIEVQTIDDLDDLCDILLTRRPDLILLLADGGGDYDTAFFEWTRELVDPDVLIGVLVGSEFLVRFQESGVVRSEAPPPVRIVHLLRHRQRSRARRKYNLYHKERLVQENKRLRFLISVDPVTGLPSGRCFLRQFGSAFSLSNRQGFDSACVLAEVDQLDQLSTRHGKSTGERLQWEFARIFRNNTRDSDVLGRLGRKHFAVLLMNCDGAAAVEWANRVRRLLCGSTLTIDSRLWNPTASFGIVANQGGIRNERDLLEQAQHALTAARCQGPNSVWTANDSGLDRQGPAAIPRTNPVVRMLVRLLVLRDARTAEHSRRVARYAADLARRIGLQENEIWAAELGGLLHDIGKMGVPDSILDKPGPLDDVERRIIDAGLRGGYDTIQRTFGAGLLADTVRGSRPEPLGPAHPVPSSRPPITGRIVAIADAYDSMTNPSPYRRARSADEALAELIGGADGPFDADLVAEFVAAANGFRS